MGCLYNESIYVICLINRGKDKVTWDSLSRCKQQQKIMVIENKMKSVNKIRGREEDTLYRDEGKLSGKEH